MARERAGRAGEAAAKLRAMLTEHRWADVGAFLGANDSHILGEQEEAEGAAQGWMRLHTACHRPVPVALMAEIVAKAPADSLNRQTAAAQPTPLHLAVSTGKLATAEAPPACA